MSSFARCVKRWVGIFGFFVFIVAGFSQIDKYVLFNARHIRAKGLSVMSACTRTVLK